MFKRYGVNEKCPSESERQDGWNVFYNQIDGMDTPLIETLKVYDYNFVDEYAIDGKKTYTLDEFIKEHFTNYRYSNFGKAWKVIDAEYHLKYCLSGDYFEFDNHASVCQKCADEQDRLAEKKFRVDVLPCGKTMDEMFPFVFSVIRFVPRERKIKA